ncbi:MAG: hypothetical protein LZF86_190069 [Nitrospira sp.]|nr:MAG: hypothetical protein LZF86_190069 [Nitrospira sp.]
MAETTSSSTAVSDKVVVPSAPVSEPAPAPQEAVSKIVEVPPPQYFADSIKPFTPDALASGFSTLVGALVGAMLAYSLQRRFQRSLDHRNALTSGHKLMFVLLQQINTIVLIQRDYVYPELNNSGRFLSIPAMPQFDTEKNILELPELAFLLDRRDGRAILYDFYLAQQNYIEALNQWNLRSALHLEKVQPALASAGISNGSNITEEQLRKVLGDHLFGHIINSTDNCIQSLGRAFDKLSRVKIRAREYLVGRFETNDFTDFDYPDTYGLRGGQT